MLLTLMQVRTTVGLSDGRAFERIRRPAPLRPGQQRDDFIHDVGDRQVRDEGGVLFERGQVVVGFVEWSSFVQSCADYKCKKKKRMGGHELVPGQQFFQEVRWDLGWSARQTRKSHLDLKRSKVMQADDELKSSVLLGRV